MSGKNKNDEKDTHSDLAALYTQFSLFENKLKKLNRRLHFLPYFRHFPQTNKKPQATDLSSDLPSGRTHKS